MFNLDLSSVPLVDSSKLRRAYFCIRRLHCQILIAIYGVCKLLSRSCSVFLVSFNLDLSNFPLVDMGNLRGANGCIQRLHLSYSYCSLSCW